ncbi:diacylglycerol/lipid kinase family protein [Azospirillum oleiclasticum]|nr:diacylglycerol kinase family protein [Azospirillum oleiclasticum]
MNAFHALAPSPEATMPAVRRRFLVIHNPVAGRRRTRRLRTILDLLHQRHAATIELRATTGRGDAETIARVIPHGTFDAVIAAGGDGTINEVVNGLAARGTDAPAVPLGLVPLGTANVLAGELGLPGGTEALASALALGPVRDVHLGVANGRCFTMMAGAGLDAQVVEAVDVRLKRLAGKGAYAVETLAQLARLTRGAYTVRVGDRAWRVSSTIIANGRFYGGRFVCAPHACLFDDRLHICLFPSLGRWNAARYIWGVMSGRLQHFPDYEIVTTDRVTIEGPPGDPVQGDGDVIARLPVEIRLSPWRLGMIVAAP